MSVWALSSSGFTYVNIEKSLEVLRWMGYKILPIWTEDTSVSVVDVGILKFLPRWSVQLDTLRSDSLPGSKGEGAGLNCIGGCDELGGLMSVIRSKIHMRQSYEILTSALASATLVYGSGYLSVSFPGYKGQAAIWTCSPRDAA